MKLSEAAKAALLNIGSPRLGQPIPRGTAPEVKAELTQYGLISKATGGLTRAGSITRDRVLDESLEFGS